MATGRSELACRNAQVPWPVAQSLDDCLMHERSHHACGSLGEFVLSGVPTIEFSQRRFNGPGQGVDRSDGLVGRGIRPPRFDLDTAKRRQLKRFVHCGGQVAKFAGCSTPEGQESPSSVGIDRVGVRDIGSEVRGQLWLVVVIEVLDHQIRWEAAIGELSFCEAHRVVDHLGDHAARVEVRR